MSDEKKKEESGQSEEERSPGIRLDLSFESSDQEEASPKPSAADSQEKSQDSSSDEGIYAYVGDLDAEDQCGTETTLSGHEMSPERYKFKANAKVLEQQKTDRLDFQPFSDMAKAVAPTTEEIKDGSFDDFEDIHKSEADELTLALSEYLESDEFREGSKHFVTDGSELDVVNASHEDYEVEEVGFDHIGTPEELLRKLERVGYICQPFIAAQISLLANTASTSLRSVMLEGPTGCGKSFLAKSLSKVTGAELMTLQCYKNMPLQHLIEIPSSMAIGSAMAGKDDIDAENAFHLGVISRAFLRSQEKPVILLVDEIDKVESAVDTFFLGPIQDGVVHLESGKQIEANRENLIIMFTKNMERPLNDALLRRVQPIEMDYMSSELEAKVLSPHCAPQLVKNLVRIGGIMRNADGSYPFERPPAPEELLRTARYLVHMLKWNITDFAFVGKNIWYMLAKSEHDRHVFEMMLRHHPDFFDPLVPDGRKASMYQVFSRLGRTALADIVEDPDAERRGQAYRPESVGLTTIGTPKEMARKLGDVGYQCLPFLATQISLVLNTPTGRVRSLLLEGPSGCGKSFLAKSLAKISGAHFMCLTCYKDMETKHLIEYPSEMAVSKMKAGETIAKESLMNLGILSRAFLKSQDQPTILLVDEIDKVDGHIDTFFLGPIQDGRIWLESRPPLDANLDNLLVIFTKNYNRILDQALLRRIHPVRMDYLDSTLERKILSSHCAPQLVANLVAIAERMRSSKGSYQFERAPAPEELLTIGHYVAKRLDWGEDDFSEVGKNIWSMLSKSEHDRAVLEHMLRFHPDFEDPLFPDGANTPIDEIYARLGRWTLRNIVDDPDAARREAAWTTMTYD